MANTQTSNCHNTTHRTKLRADANKHRIDCLRDRDDAGLLVPWKSRLHGLRLYVSVLSTSLTYAYFALRMKHLLNSQTQSKHTLWTSWIFLAVEIMNNCE